MIGERLHAFDLSLTEYVLDNVRAHLRDPAFAAYVEEQLDPRTLAYLKALGDDVEPPPLLLSDAELEDLIATFLVGPQELDQAWAPYESLHRRHIDCAADIRDGLAAEYLREWARACARFAEQLESDRVGLSGGIEVVREWVREARRLLRAMGATALLPPPDGTFPTPTCPEPPALPAAEATTGSNGPRNDDALTTTILEIRDLLLHQRTVKDWYSTDEVAQVLGKAEFTVREWCRRGRVGAEKKGSGRGKYQGWVISHPELLRIQREGLLPVKG